MLRSEAMRTYTDYLTIQTKQPREVLAITEQVKAAVHKSEFANGLILVGSLHLNAAVLLGINDPAFFEDLEAWLEQLAPARETYTLGRKFESNASTLLKTILAQSHVSVAFSEGRLDLGPWQEILYAEFDGQRPKRVVIKVLGE
jgi:secondary thiamine-phosphate synthase enzyme